MAPADLDADGARPPAPAGPRCDPGLGDPAAGGRRAQDPELAGGAPAPDAHLRPARPVRGLPLAVVRRDLPAPHGVAGRLHRAATVRLLARLPGRPAGRPPQPEQASGPRGVHHRGGAGRRPAACGPLALPPAPGLDGHDYRAGGLGGRRAWSAARGRQPPVPPVGSRGAGRLRDREPVRLQGRRDPRGRQRLLQLPDAVRRLRPGRPLQGLPDGAVLLHRARLQGAVAGERTAAGHGPRVPGAADLPQVLPGRSVDLVAAEELRPQGEPPAHHRRHPDLPDRARLRTGDHGPRRCGPQGLRRADDLPAGELQLRVVRGGEGTRPHARAATSGSRGCSTRRSRWSTATRST